MPEPSSARCAEHDAPSIGPCERCGTFVCPRCGALYGQVVRCHRCGPPAPERPPRGATVALVLSALGLACPPVSLVGIGVALGWLGGGRTGSKKAAEYARWALALGLISIALWVIYALVVVFVFGDTFQKLLSAPGPAKP